MTRPILLIATLASLGLVASSEAQVAKSGNGYLLRYKFVKGQTYKYNMKADVTVSGLPAQAGQPSKPMTQNVTMTISMTVAEVKNSIATLKIKVTQGSKVEERTAKVNNRGKLVEGGQGLESAGLFELPEKAVAAGATWVGNANAAVPGSSSAMSAKTTYKFEGIKVVNGKSLAEISSVSNVTGVGTMKVIGTSRLNVSDGVLFSQNSNLNGDVPNPMASTGKPMKISGKTVISRI